MKLRCVIVAMLLLLPFAARGQFYSAGDNPSSTKWYQVQSPHYKIIYPKGLDSLAKVYGSSLEKYYSTVGLSAGYIPGEYSRGRMPVVLHPFNAYSNGSVAWAPKIMNLFTSPQAYNPEAMPWVDMLTIHEQRHYVQMQTGLSGVFRPFGWFFGEMFNGLVAGLWQGSTIMEGDAVGAETALSRSGRGRSSEFMNYYMIAFDQGDFRNWQRWILGSQKYHSLDHYSAGYLMLGGSRFLYGNSLMTSDMFHRAAEKMSFISLRKVLKQTAGVTPKTAYKEIADTLNKVWQKEMESRKPYIFQEQVVKTPRRFTEYEHLVFVDDELFAVRQGKTRVAEIVKIDSLGREKFVTSFAGVSSPLHYLPSLGRLYWSEGVPSARWSMKINSQIRYYDLKTGLKHSLTRKGRIFNPCPSPDETMICAAEYFDDGRTGLTVVDAKTGSKVASRMAPDSLQIIEIAWMNGEIYCSAVSSNGYGIYSVKWNDSVAEFSGDWEMAIAPQPVQITNFGGEDGALHFAGDRTGVYELYHFDIASRRLFQETSTRYGANDFVHSPDGRTMYYSVKRYEGNLVTRTPADSLLEKDVDFADIHLYSVAEELSRQEREIATSSAAQTSRNDGAKMSLNDVSDNTVSFTQPKRYRKFPHMLRIHSWAPVYFNIDNIMAMSGEKLYDFVSLGATALSQNDLGTATMQIGYSAHKDPYDRAAWRHSGHLTFTCSGWYPVFEASLDFNDRGARQYGIAKYYDNYDYAGAQFLSRAYGAPFVSGKLSVYIPFNFSRGGWITGLIPKVTYNITNDFVYTRILSFNTLEWGGQYLMRRTSGRNELNQGISGSLRFYTMRPVAESAVYPRWGFGIEAGAAFRPGLTDFYSPMGYLHIYGYLPGVVPQQGLNLKALYQTNLLPRQAYLTSSIVNTAPRGLADSGLSYIASRATNSLKLSAQYAIPIFIGDVNFWNAFIYIHRLVVTPHFDYTFFGTGLRGLASEGLFSAGATVAFDMKSLFWLKFPFELGVTFSYNGGPSYRNLSQTAGLKHPFFVGPVFSVSFK